MATAKSKRGAPAQTSKRERQTKPPKTQADNPEVRKAAKAAARRAKIARWNKGVEEERAKLPPPAPRLVVHDGDQARPNKYTPEMGARICHMFATDPSMRLTKMNADPSLPTVYTFYNWLNEHADLAKLYAHARDIQSDLKAEELEDIAAEPLIGEVIVHGQRVLPDGSVVDITERRTADNIERTKLRVNVRQWLLSKQRPKKYGIAPETTGTGVNPQLQALFDSINKGPVE